MVDEFATGIGRRSVIKLLGSAGVVSGLGGSAVAAQTTGGSGSGSNSSNGLPQVLPTPQHVERRGDPLQIPSVATLVTSDSADPPAVRAAETVLRSAGVEEIRRANPGDQFDSPLVVFLGEPAKTQAIGDALARLNVEFPADLSAEGYILASGDVGGEKRIVLAGVDGTGTYYATQTLGQLVRHENGQSNVPRVAVTDYPDLPMRGVVEGFYGAWSHEDRLRQLEFYGDVKDNIYIYAPKGDPYHRVRWRDPYPPEEIDKFDELVTVARDNHVEFTFALSPGLSICYSSDSDFQALVDKFQTMYDVGVRTFNVPLDDIVTSWNCEKDKQRFGEANGKSAGMAQAYFLNKVQREFIETHDGASLQMVPTEYYNVAESPYKRALRQELDDAITVMWTGIGVKAYEITQSQAQAAHDVFGHDILVWDNYPINEGSPDRLYLGPVTGRDPGLADHGVVGFTSNPMYYSEASKIPLGTVADYTWNGYAYDPKGSWKLSMRRFAGDAYETMRTFAENTRSTPLKNSLSESPDLTRSIDAFWTAYESGDAGSEANALAHEFDAIEAAPGVLTERMTNETFLSEVEPWFEVAELTGAAGKRATAMLTAQRAGNGEKVWRMRQSFLDAFGQLKEKSEKYAPGVAPPFFRNALIDNSRWLGLSVPVTPTTTMGSYGGHDPGAMIDDDLDTFYWGTWPSVDDSVGVDLGETNEIAKIEILMGNAATPSDYIHHGVLEISTDGETWTAIGEFTDQPEISVTPPDGTVARYVRLRIASEQTKWVIVREFSVETADSTTVSGGPPAADGSALSYATDGSSQRAYVAARPPEPDESLVVTTDTRRTLGQITVLQDSDEPANADVQIRTDVGWTTVGQLDGGYTEIELGGLTTSEIRLAWAGGTTVPVIHEIVLWAGTAPTDPDGDGDYEDLTGDGRITTEDVQAYAARLDDPSFREKVEKFDYNENGRIDHADLVTLAEER